MPGLNGRGPDGGGPRTGRGLGNCSKSTKKKTTKKRPVSGRGSRRGRRQ